MAKNKTRTLLSAAFAAFMSMGLISPVAAQTTSKASGDVPKNEIYFDEPVSEGTLSGSAGAINGSVGNAWQQLSLPIGNSRMGANVFGETDKERLTFNEKTVWNGGPSSRRPNYNGGNKTTINGKATSEYYKDVVNAFKTNASNKDSLANGLVGEQDGYGSYQLLGDIYLDFDREDNGAWDAYWTQYWASGSEIIDDRDSSITYTGWSDWAKAGWNNDTEKYTNTVGAEINLTFTGKAIRMIGARNSECGKLDVYLDGEKVLEDHVMTSSTAADGQELFALHDLENTEHTLRVVNKTGGSHNKASYDYFQVKKSAGTTQKVVDLNPSNAATTGVQYSSDWQTWSRSGESDASEWIGQEEMYVNSCNTDTTISYTFTGTGIALFGAKNGNSQANMGSFTWSVDGSEPVEVNCVRTETSIKRMELFSKTDLAEGEHTVVIKGVNKKLSFDNLVVYANGGDEAEPEKPQPPKEHTAATNYKRWLDLDNALAGVEYDRDDTHYTREYFASFPDNVIAIKVTADGAQALDFDLSIPMAAEGTNANGKTTTTVTDNNGNMTINGKMNDNDLKLAAKAKVITDEGTVTGNGSVLEIRDASEAVIFISAGTDYEDSYPAYRTGETDAQVAARVNDTVDKAAAKGYDAIRADHLEDYKEIYDRVKVDLGQTLPEKTTDVLLAGYKNKSIPASERRYLETELYQYGRYLQIASSRQGDSLPANLQGVWSVYSGATGNVPWGSDYHMNVNLQMNYWPTYSTNMAECAMPMIEYIDALREPGRVTASTYFGIDNSNGQHNGFSAHTQNTPFGWTCPGWAFSWGWSPAAVPWMLQNVYEYYEYTGDVEFLENTIFPMLEEEAKLYEEILIEMTYDNGVSRLTTVPAYSPEHGPYTAGNVYENSLVWQLFNDCIEAADVLNANKAGTVSEETIAKWQQIKDQLKPIEIGDSGQIKEWYNETTLGSVNGADLHHRHMSHLLGLMPGDLITINTPEYLEAAKVSLNSRGDSATGWGLAQRINAWARVKDGDRALVLIENLFRDGMYNNLWDAHPPFQIDGNFGYTSGVTEMLMQSNAGTIELLPALPSAWSEGTVSGLVGRGNFELTESWKDGKLTSASFLSKNGGTCKVTSADLEGMTVVDSDGKAVEMKTVEGTANTVSFETEAGKTYELAVHEDLPVVPELDKTLLEAAVDKAGKLDLNAFAMTGAEKTALNALIEEGQGVLNSAKTQKEIDDEASKVNDALLVLRRTPSKEALAALK